MILWIRPLYLNEYFNQKNLLIDSLKNRIKKNNLKEVIIATSATVEGQTTAHYIEDIVKNGVADKEESKPLKKRVRRKTTKK